MNESELLNRILLLEYHQKLLLKLISNPNLDFYKTIIENGLSEQEVMDFYRVCDKLTNKMEEQKADGFIYYQPLFTEFLRLIPPKMEVKKVIPACCRQGIFVQLMIELKKYL